jgi:predicted  nucleic acid-binding Zn-ribbon protein
MDPWAQLLEVQQIDSRIAKLDHRDANLPERARLAEIEEQLAGVRTRTAQAQAEKDVLAGQQRRIEDEIAGLEARIAKEEQVMYGGGSSDPGLLQDLQHEITGLKGRISVLEDQELELMEQMEPVDARLAALADEQAALDQQAISTTTELAEAEVAIAAERAAAVAEREQAATGIEPEALARYEKVRDRLGGTAVARLEAGVCGACHMKLSAVEYDRILHLPADDEVRCEDCDRFLVRA